MKMEGKTLPVLTVVAGIFAIWYACTVWLNAPFEYDKATRISKPAPTISQIIPLTMSQERPVLPAPHQVAQEIYKTTVFEKADIKTIPVLPCLDYTFRNAAWFHYGNRIGSRTGDRDCVQSRDG